MTDADTILELINVSKQFGGIQAVENFDLKIKKGELHCLIGPNGAGKTTVFKLITGVYPVSSGRILFRNQDITNKNPTARAKLGISLKMQIPGIYEDLTLYENLKLAATNYIQGDKMLKEIDRLIHLVRLDTLGNPIVKNMSHGQQQWLEIAMVLVASPELLLLDEPAAGMGPEETNFTAELVRELNAQGITILFIDHDMDFVRKIAKKVTVLHYGRKFAEGTIEDIEKHDGVKKIYLGSE
jgi:ABC-type uncharacterized transport system ATPase subunit